MKDITKNKPKFSLVYFIIAFLGVLMIQNYVLNYNGVKYISYNEFQSLLSQNKIKEVLIGEKKITGSLIESTGGENLKFSTNRVDEDLVLQLQKHKVKYSQKVENTIFRDMLSWIVPTLIFFGIWMYFVRKMSAKEMGGSFMSVGKSKAKIFMETDIKVSFSDVAGVDEAKAELEEVVNFLKTPKEYGRLGGRLPKGILLVGAPGTGKTLLAKAVAGEARVPFFSISGSEFVEMFVGVGAARVRDLFEQARLNAPCIIFIDELDALGKARGISSFGGHDEKEQTLNQLLSELDGFDSREGLVLLGATNRPEILDPALLRSGRFDRQVLVDRPDKKGREQILKVHIKNIKIASETHLDQVAALTTGFTGADLANLVNEAALVATRKNKKAVSVEDFSDAIERIVAGLEKKNRIINEFEREVTAYHEMGHAIVAHALKCEDVVHKVSIIPRGIGALGYTIQRPTEERYLLKKEEMENKIATLMGGRAAEKIIFNHISTGASDDLSKATDLAKSMVMTYGMSETLGQVSLEKPRQNFLNYEMKERDFSEETAREVDQAVKEINYHALEKAENILRKNCNVLMTSAQKLLEKETLNQQELEKIFLSIV